MHAFCQITILTQLLTVLCWAVQIKFTGKRGTFDI